MEKLPESEYLGARVMLICSNFLYANICVHKEVQRKERIQIISEFIA
jgi:hypothetical protein